MEHETAAGPSLVDELAPELAVALRLHRAGYSAEVIATALAIPRESVASTLEVASAKLRAVMARVPRERPDARPGLQ